MISTTYQGILASAAARREEAMIALAFLRQVTDLAESTRSLKPEGQAMAKAVEDARSAAVEAVCLWRTAVAETRRAVQSSGERRAAGVGR